MGAHVARQCRDKSLWPLRRSGEPSTVMGRGLCCVSRWSACVSVPCVVPAPSLRSVQTRDVAGSAYIEPSHRSTNQPALVSAAASTQGALAQFLIADSLQRGDMLAGRWARAWARGGAIRRQSQVVPQLQQRPSEASAEPWEPDDDFAFPPHPSPSSPCPPRPLRSKPVDSSLTTLKFGAL